MCDRLRAMGASVELLDVRSIADLDQRFVAAQHCPKPDACPRANLNFADEDGGGRDVRVRMNLRPVPCELEFQGSL